ncbi:MAG: chemotaxis protein CheW [Bacteroidota bacterium]
MSSGYIVFCHSNCNFIVPLEQFHIILNPDEIVNKIGSDESNVNNLYFGNKLINIIHLSEYLNAESRKITPNSRLLVGEFEGHFIGFWVDNITEIINVEDKKFESLEIMEANQFLKEVNVEGQDYNVINLNNIIKEKLELNSSQH